MKFYIVIFLLGYIAMYMCWECRWTRCEGLTYSGKSLCAKYGYGKYTGLTDKRGCSWDTEKVKCCKATEKCEWSNLCYGDNYGASYVCRVECGENYKPSGQKQACSGFKVTRYECCR